MSSNFYNAQFISGGTTFAVELFTRAGLTANYSLGLPNTAPTDGQYLQWNSAAGAFVWNTPSAGGGGSVSSVGLSLPNIFTVTNSPVTTSGTLTAALASQLVNTVFAAPSGAAGAPSFRTLVNADIPSGIDAAKITGTLARANIPGGTSATSFQISTGVTLVDSAGSLRVCGADGATLTDITCANLVITGNIDTQSSTNTNIGDSTLTMLSGYTGSSPSTDAAFTVKRGTLSNASLKWVETTDVWQAGLDSNLLNLARSSAVAITNASISGGVYTFTHNLGNTDRDPTVVVKRNDGRQIMLGVTFSNANSCVVDFSKVGTLTGTWTLTASC